MSWILSLSMLVAIALIPGAIVLWQRGGSRLQALLMLVLAVVIAANVAIVGMPVTPSDQPTLEAR